MPILNTSAINALAAARHGDDLTPEQGLELLLTTDPDTIYQIRDTADFVRRQQSGDTSFSCA